MSDIQGNTKQELQKISSKKTEIQTISDLFSGSLGGPESQKNISERSGTKILILFYQEYPNQQPTHDVVVDQFKKVLLDLGYSVSLLPINQSIDRITNGIKQEKPDLVFNLCETFRNNDRFETNITALLEMFKVPFTGSAPSGLFLSNDKHISKKIFDFHRIPYADFFVVRVGQDVSVPRGFVYPLFVKPVREDASIGIDDNSVVYDYQSLAKKVKELHETLGGDVMVEEFIDGREFYVSVVGDDGNIRALPIVELDFSNWPEGKPKIYSNKAKIDETSEEYKKINFDYGETLKLSDEVQRKMKELAVKTAKALDVRDYARVDMRMDKDGKIYVLEANLNPYLNEEDILAMSASVDKISYPQLIEEIVRCAIARGRITV